MGSSSTLTLFLFCCLVAEEAWSSSLSAAAEVTASSSLGGAVFRGAEGESVPGGKKFLSFRSIPFAEPPTGALRLRPPRPKEDLVGKAAVVDASAASPACPQLVFDPETLLEVEVEVDGEAEVVGQEDCLYLNVYVPEREDDKLLLPVLVFFHGGNFVSGSSADLGPEYLMDSGDVVLVTANYRLGPLGWISNEDDELPGNLGLLDQKLALKWVRDHVSNFGGDPDRVTAAGHSSGGGSSVVTMLASPAFEGLFRGVAAMSAPSFNSPISHSSDSPAFYAAAFAERVGCDEAAETAEIVQCLQSKSVDELVSASSMFGGDKLAWVGNPWKPTEEGRSVPAGGVRAVMEEDGAAHGVSVMFGTAEADGDAFLPQFDRDPSKYQEVSSDFDTLGVQLLLNADEHSATEEDASTAHLIRMHYLDNSTFSKEKSGSIGRMLTDVYFRGPVHGAVEALKKKAEQDVYYYFYRFKRNGGAPSHGDDLRLLFKIGDENLTDEELKVSHKLVTLWSRFVGGSPPHPRWRPLRGSDSATEYAVLDEKPLRMSMGHEYQQDLAFLRAMTTLVEHYRHLDMSQHPAVLAMIRDREEAAIEDLKAHDEL